MSNQTGPSEVHSDAERIAQAAKAAYEASQLIPSSQRVKALYEIIKELESSKAEILEANRKDLKVRSNRLFQRT